MPIQIIMTEGLISKTDAQAIHREVAQAFLDAHQISANPFMVPNVIGEVLFVDKELTFAGKQLAPLAIIELRVPSFTFTSQAQKDQFVQKTTNIVFDAAGGQLSRESIWVNAVYTVDGLWGIGGKAYSNEELGQAIAQAAN